MATEQHDRDYGGRTILRVTVLISALMGVGVFIIPTVEYGPKISTVGWVLIAIWVMILIVGGIWAGRVQAHYHCPKCGARLPMLRPEKASKYQHRFHCPSCDIIWTTDIFAGD